MISVKHSDSTRKNVLKAIAANRERAKGKRVIFTCRYCGESKLLPQSTVNYRGGKKYCSWECRWAAMRGENAPNYGGGQKMKGEGNPMWKGGVSLERKGRSMMVEQAKWRRLVFSRDKYVCQRCGYDKGKKINAHHKASWSEFPDKRFELSNGITLCKECHDWVHSEENIDSEFICKS